MMKVSECQQYLLLIPILFQILPPSSCDLYTDVSTLQDIPRYTGRIVCGLEIYLGREKPIVYISYHHSRHDVFLFSTDRFNCDTQIFSSDYGSHIAFEFFNPTQLCGRSQSCDTQLVVSYTSTYMPGLKNEYFRDGLTLIADGKMFTLNEYLGLNIETTVSTEADYTLLAHIVIPASPNDTCPTGYMLCTFTRKCIPQMLACRTDYNFCDDETSHSCPSSCTSSDSCPSNESSHSSLILYVFSALGVVIFLVLTLVFCLLCRPFRKTCEADNQQIGSVSGSYNNVIELSTITSNHDRLTTSDVDDGGASSVRSEPSLDDLPPAYAHVVADYDKYKVSALYI